MTLRLMDGSDFQKDMITSPAMIKKILGKVTDIKDRANFEMTCKLVKSVSKETPWKFTSDGDLLRIEFHGISSELVVQCGTLQFNRKSLIFSDRRDEDPIRTSQPEPLLNTLNGLAQLFAKNIQRLEIGGHGDPANLHGRGSQMLVVTADLIGLLVVNFSNAQKIDFKDVVFDKGACDYLHALRDTPFPRLTCLSLSRIHLDDDARPAALKKLINPNLETLSLLSIKVEDVGAAVVERLIEENIILDNLNLRLEEYNGSEGINHQIFLRNIGRRCKNIDVTLYQIERTPSPTIVGALLGTVELPNLVGLRFHHTPKGRQGCHDFDEAITKFKTAIRLEKLSITGWSDEKAIDKLSDSLNPAFLLQKLVLANIPKHTSHEDLKKFIQRMPIFIEHLEFTRSPLNDEHLNLLAQRLDFLKTISLYSLSLVTSHGIGQNLPYWNKLEEFRSNITMESGFILDFCNSKNLPNLKNACFTMEAKKMPEYVFKQLGSTFEEVRCTNFGFSDYLCEIHINGRKPLAFPQSYTEVFCDHDSSLHFSLPDYEEIEW